MRGRWQLGHAAIYARDKGRLQTFYQNVFDMKQLPGDARGEVARLAFDPTSGLCDLSVVSHPNGVHMTFYTDSLEELETLHERLIAARVPAAGLTLEDRGVSFCFSDPEGNRIKMAWVGRHGEAAGEAGDGKGDLTYHGQNGG